MLLAITALTGLAAAQNITQSTAPSATINGSAIANPTLFATTLNVNVEDLWNLLIGPVSSAATTTTVSATDVPSSSLIPPPPLYYSPYPTGQQVFAEQKNDSWSFPKDFWWGVAGASYQIEGAVKAEGRGPSIWDALSHRAQNYVVNNYTADVTDNNYYLYKQDIARIAALGVKTYSFTLSWSRILPFGRGPVNQDAVAHYSDVIDTCLEYGIIPQVTLYHWDLPLFLQDTYGGWLSGDIVPDFVEYSRIAYAAFGDRVKHWFTVNEPTSFCNRYPLPSDYFKNVTIPDIQQKFFCAHNVLLAHSQAYRLGKSMMPDSLITLKLNGGYKIPLKNSTADAEAVQRAWDFNEGLFSNPTFLTGDYPATVKEYVSNFLPDFTDGQKYVLNGSADFYAHDAYTAQFYFAPDSGIEACLSDVSNPLYPTWYDFAFLAVPTTVTDVSSANTSYTYSAEDGGWVIGPAADELAPWLHKATDWLPAFLHYIQDTWKPSGGIAITEFGFAEPGESKKTLLQDILYDPVRISYYHDYTRAMLAAMSDGVNVIGCLAWSLYDNYEWSSGFAVTFGMQYVNFSDSALPRVSSLERLDYI